jgi:hypothetical protein
MNSEGRYTRNECTRTQPSDGTANLGAVAETVARTMTTASHLSTKPKGHLPFKDLSLTRSPSATLEHRPFIPLVEPCIGSLLVPTSNSPPDKPIQQGPPSPSQRNQHRTSHLDKLNWFLEAPVHAAGQVKRKRMDQDRRYGMDR